jgi:hypothetical protein
VERLVSSPAIQFKGTGWYVTDYGRGGSSAGKSESNGGQEAAKDAANGPTKDAGKTDGAAAPAKTEKSGASNPPPASTSKR